MCLPAPLRRELTGASAGDSLSAQCRPRHGGAHVRGTHYSVTSSRTMLTYTSKPRSVPTNSLSPFMITCQSTAHSPGQHSQPHDTPPWPPPVCVQLAGSECCPAGRGRTQRREPTHLSTSSLGSRCDGLLPVSLVGSAAMETQETGNTKLSAAGTHGALLGGIVVRAQQVVARRASA